MAKSNKERAQEIYNQHIALASTDGRLFRKTVREQMMAETGCSGAAASTFYNNSKKASAPIEGLGRAPIPKGVRKPGSKPGAAVELQADDDCFSVMEVIDGSVCRCQSFAMQGDASEEFDSRIAHWPNSLWIFIKGMGPNSGDPFKLERGESEIQRFTPKVAETV